MTAVPQAGQGSAGGVGQPAEFGGEVLKRASVSRAEQPDEAALLGDPGGATSARADGVTCSAQA